MTYMRSKQVKITSTDPNLTIHVVLRVRSDDGRTMEEHVKVLKKSGRVLFAKIGKGLGGHFFDQLNYQIENKIPWIAIKYDLVGAWSINSLRHLISIVINDADCSDK